jgi:hypothetical protein
MHYRALKNHIVLKKGMDQLKFSSISFFIGLVRPCVAKVTLKTSIDGLI